MRIREWETERERERGMATEQLEDSIKKRTRLHNWNMLFAHKQAGKKLCELAFVYIYMVALSQPFRFMRGRNSIHALILCKKKHSLDNCFTNYKCVTNTFRTNSVPKIAFTLKWKSLAEQKKKTIYDFFFVPDNNFSSAGKKMVLLQKPLIFD